MICPNCQHDNSSMAAFCEECGGPLPRPQQGGFSAGMVALLLAAIICLIAGGLYLTKVTAGVGGIAAACFFAIVARIVQAARK